MLLGASECPINKGVHPNWRALAKYSAVAVLSGYLAVDPGVVVTLGRAIGLL